jgi:hypothetical protein
MEKPKELKVEVDKTLVRYKRRLLLNEHIKPETEAFANSSNDSTKAEELLKAGFEL